MNLLLAGLMLCATEEGASPIKATIAAIIVYLLLDLGLRRLPRLA